MILRPRQALFVERSLSALDIHGNTLGVAPSSPVASSTCSTGSSWPAIMRSWDCPSTSRVRSRVCSSTRESLGAVRRIPIPSWSTRSGVRQQARRSCYGAAIRTSRAGQGGVPAYWSTSWPVMMWRLCVGLLRTFITCVLGLIPCAGSSGSGETVFKILAMQEKIKI